MEELTNEKSLGTFLKSARQRVQPEMVGLKRTQRRRTAGLRREEVAELANIGVSWYTSIEQGKLVHPSAQVLESIANALLLNTLEKSYLFELANPTEPSPVITEQALPAGIKAIISTLDPNPAYVIDYCWNIVEWNDAASFVFDYSSYDRVEKRFPNLINHFLLSEHMKAMIDDWEKRAQVMVYRYKAEFIKNPQDKAFLNNIEFLEKESPLFKAEWAKNDIRILNNSSKIWQHPSIGEITFDQIILTTPELVNYQLFTFMAHVSTKLKLINKQA